MLYDHQRKLRPHQAKAVAESPDKWGFWFRQRVGKTAASIRFMSARAKHCLIIVPKSLKNQWIREVEAWNNSKTVFYVISKEDARLNKNIPDQIDACIWDEIHLAGANYKSQTYKAVEKLLIVNNTRFVLLLSGTPYTGPWSVYSYGKLLGKDWKWFDWKNHFFFDMKFCHCKTPCRHRKIPKPRAGKDGELQTILRRIGTVIDLKDVADITDDVDIVEEFCLNKIQTALIEDAFDPLPIVRLGAQHQLEQGVRKAGPYDEGINIQVDKDKRLVELVAAENKVVVVCKYLNQIAKYEKLFAKLKRPIFTISGQVKEQAGDVALRAESSQSAIVIIQADCCTGYSLQSFDLMIFASMSYSFVSFDQMKSRLKNMDKNTACEYVYLLTQGDSMDKAVYDCVSKKQDFSVEFFGK